MRIVLVSIFLITQAAYVQKYHGLTIVTIDFEAISINCATCSD